MYIPYSFLMLSTYLNHYFELINLFLVLII